MLYIVLLILLPPSSYSLVSSCSNDKVELANDILTWKSYGDFSKFCAKISLLFNYTYEVKVFLNSIRCQQSLSPINLEDSVDCVEFLKALRL